MRELEIPYIGIKIESIPTILKVAQNSIVDKDFYAYYQKLGKTTRTADEYLRSLRNLKLANTDKDNNTRINKNGEKLLLIGDDLIYKILLEHCLKTFPDLKIVRNVVRHNNIKTLNQLIVELENDGYTMKRKQTLSSYFKLFFEGGELNPRKKKPVIKSDSIEYHQFKKLVRTSPFVQEKVKFPISELYEYILGSTPIEKSTFTYFLDLLRSQNQVRLYTLDADLAKKKGPEEIFEINNKQHYYFEIIQDVV